jgi:polysaccharide pyruvyl transferase WcaK-like protein
VGKLKFWINRWLTKKVFSHALATLVRDKDSAELLKKLGIQNVTIGSDPALSYFKSLSGSQTVRSDILLLSLRLWPGFSEKEWKQSIEMAKKVAKENHLKLILMEMDLKNGKEIALLRKVANDHNIEIFEPTSAEAAYKAIEKAKMLIGMRLHSLIMSYAADTPFTAIPYSQKVKSFQKNDLTIQNQAFLKQVFENL